MITVITGFGYFKDSEEHIVAKAMLPPGSHPMLYTYTYVEVADQAALDLVEVYVPALTQNEQYEALIPPRVRALAIASLIADELLPENYE
jgi:hypothetical protein